MTTEGFWVLIVEPHCTRARENLSLSSDRILVNGLRGGQICLRATLIAIELSFNTRADLRIS